VNLKELLLAAIDRFGNQQAVGEQVGVDRTRISRAMRGEHSLEVVNCLRLAKAMDMNPAEVLRAAGKADVAALLEGFYEQPSISPSERELLKRWATLTDSSRRSLLAVMQELATAEGRKSKKTA
jgi:DNA-binding phage protein